MLGGLQLISRLLDEALPALPALPPEGGLIVVPWDWAGREPEARPTTHVVAAVTLAAPRSEMATITGTARAIRSIMRAPRLPWC